MSHWGRFFLGHFFNEKDSQFIKINKNVYTFFRKEEIMKDYVKKLSEKPSFERNGFDGYIADIDNENISITYEKVYKGHDKYCTNTESTHIYYVISGNGRFKINENMYEVEKGNIIEIPKNTKFIFAGKMELLLIMNPKFNRDNNIDGEENDLY